VSSVSSVSRTLNSTLICLFIYTLAFIISTMGISIDLWYPVNEVLLRKVLTSGDSLQANDLGIAFNCTLTVLKSGNVCTEIKLSSNGRRMCHHPYFRIRLSGSSLLNIPVTAREDYSFEGCSKLSVTGTYFVDVSLIHCNNINTVNMTNNTKYREILGIPVWPNLSYKFHSFVFNYSTWQGRISTKSHYSWVYLPERRSMSSKPFKFISTKYQLDGWENNSHDFFSTYTHQRFDGFEWREINSKTGLVIPFNNRRSTLGLNLSLFFWGASHMRYLRNYLLDKYYNFTSEKDACETDFEVFYADGPLAFYFISFVNVLQSDLIANISLQRELSVIASAHRIHVVSLGQWEASWKSDGDPSTPLNFRKNLIHLIHIIKSFLNSKQVLIVVTVNVSAMGSLYLNGRDWRIPPVIDAYNQELFSLTSGKHNVTPWFLNWKNDKAVFVLDNTDIIDPIWDSATDFCHPCRYGTPAIAERLLHSLELISSDIIK
jgi:hypothetical protein